MWKLYITRQHLNRLDSNPLEKALECRLNVQSMILAGARMAAMVCRNCCQRLFFLYCILIQKKFWSEGEFNAQKTYSVCSVIFI